VEGSCEYRNELSGSIKFWKIFEYLRNWQSIKQDYAPLN
jgi:hypothetical protein